AIVPDGSALEENRASIDAIFALGTIDEILQSLQDEPSDFATAALKGLSRGAPLLLKTTLAAIRAARDDGSLIGALRNEYRIVSTCLQDGELIEGIRALVIDKDRSPKWKYPTLESVPQDMIDRLYQPAQGGDFAVE
ncbi:MAG: enoyl-CoA hydratase/isomerase family protein, partial [Amylibacter sp.]